MADRYDVKPAKGKSNKWVAFNVRTGNILSKPVSQTLARDIAKAISESRSSLVAKHLRMDGLDEDLADMRRTKVYVWATLTQGELESYWEEGVRDFDGEDLTYRSVGGVCTDLYKANRQAMDSLLANVRENEMELLLCEDGEETLPGVLEEAVERIMTSLRWVDSKDQPMVIELRRRLHEYGEDKGEPYGRPRMVAYLEEPSAVQPDKWSLEGILVVEEVILDEEVTNVTTN